MEPFPRPDPATSPTPIDDYLATIVEIELADGTLVVTPSEGATTPAPTEFTSAHTVHLITAANPYSMPFDDEANEVRNVEAAGSLQAAGLRFVASRGRDAGRTWEEPGFALLDADDATVLRLADEWCQHGIYRWDADGWWLVLTDGSAPTSYPVAVTLA